jgi:hypothetical protein
LKTTASEDISAIRRAIDELQQASQALAMHMSGRQTAGAGARTSANNRHDGQAEPHGRDE